MNILKLNLSSFFSFIVLSLFGHQKPAQGFSAEELWEKGVACFLNEDDRGSINYFEKLLLLIDKNSTKFNPANYYLAHSYRAILKTEGLTSSEADRMFYCYDIYLSAGVTLMNEARNQEVKDFIARKKRNKPVQQLKKWVDTSD